MLVPFLLLNGDFFFLEKGSYRHVLFKKYCETVSYI